MEQLKKHIWFDAALFMVLGIVFIALGSQGGSFELLYVIVMAPMLFSIHMLLVLILGLIKWNKSYLVYSLLGLVLCGLALLTLYNWLQNANLKIGGSSSIIQTQRLKLFSQYETRYTGICFPP